MRSCGLRNGGRKATTTVTVTGGWGVGGVLGGSAVVLLLLLYEYKRVGNCEAGVSRWWLVVLLWEFGASCEEDIP